MSIFVGRIPRGTDEKELEEIFSKIGKLSRCEIKRDGMFSPWKIFVLDARLPPCCASSVYLLVLTFLFDRLWIH